MLVVEPTEPALREAALAAHTAGAALWELVAAHKVLAALAHMAALALMAEVADRTGMALADEAMGETAGTNLFRMLI
jgi:hypothetical protein